MSFSEQIISWYKINKRELPWRETKDPYLIWLSEIILQQTRVDQGMPYYLKFAETYPDIKSLASAPEENVLKLWQGLGYYSRARNMHFTAKHISNELKGVFPKTYDEILKLKGVGEYTAAAIASFAYNEITPVVDGNVFRVLSRYFGITDPIDTSLGKKKIMDIAKQIISKKNPAIYNQAIMEFGARQCSPKNPSCETCPLSYSCEAFIKNLQQTLPIKIKKIKQRERHFNYLVVNDQEKFLFQQRTKKDIWEKLYEFPLIETEVQLNEEELVSSTAWNSFFKNKRYILKSVSKVYKHILSHQVIYTRFWNVEMKEAIPVKKPLFKTETERVSEYAVPKLIENYMNDEPELFYCSNKR